MSGAADSASHGMGAHGHMQAENVGDGSSGEGYARDHGEPEQFGFDEQSEREIATAVAQYPPGRQASAVIECLYLAARQMRRETGSGWVPRVAMDAVAQRLGMAPIRVYEVATFYTMFPTTPVGRLHLQVCTTTPCWLRGSDEIVAACRKVSGIRHWHETSADGLFTMTQVECLGACVNAPILQINDDYYEDVDGPTTERMLEAAKRGEALPKPGSMTGRLWSAPDGGRTTLLTDPRVKRADAATRTEMSGPGAGE